MMLAKELMFLSITLVFTCAVNTLGPVYPLRLALPELMAMSRGCD